MNALCLILVVITILMFMSCPARAVDFRDLKTGSWVATDAMGRSLPGYAECGPPRERRFVGIFYFFTFGEREGNGPRNVTEIKAANPAEPGFTRGAHYWGEPEYGYYLSTDSWVIRRHAHLLADAGVWIRLEFHHEAAKNTKRVIMQMRVSSRNNSLCMS